MSLHTYWAYGLCIHADLDCPELPPYTGNSGSPDVTIHLLPALPTASDIPENRACEVQPGIFRLTVPGVARYRVEEGSRIIIEPLPDAPIETVRLFLFGSVMGALLYQRGLFPLHGSAVETPWGAMIFVGVQGAGKSTLAAQFHHRGYRLLSDDVCAVASTAEGLQILPALAKFRICTDAFERLGAPQEGHFEVDKYVVPMGAGYCPHSLPLRAIHVLQIVDAMTPECVAPAFQMLSGFDRVQRLLENLYRPQYLKGQQTQAMLMRLAAVIARKAIVAVVTRRPNPCEADELVDFLESVWADHFDIIPSAEQNMAIHAEAKI